MDETHPVPVKLTDDERELLRCGLREWGGPARCTEEFARALGFDSVSDLFVQGDRLRHALRASDPLTPLDWARTLLATETVFASRVVGAGADWPITTGFSDQESLQLLRTVQKKLARLVRPVVGNGLGTRPPSPA